MQFGIGIVVRSSARRPREIAAHWIARPVLMTASLVHSAPPVTALVLARLLGFALVSVFSFPTPRFGQGEIMQGRLFDHNCSTHRQWLSLLQDNPIYKQVSGGIIVRCLCLSGNQHASRQMATNAFYVFPWFA